MRRESLRRPAPVRDPPRVPDLRLGKPRRSVEPVLVLLLTLSLHFPFTVKRSMTLWAWIVSMLFSLEWSQYVRWRFGPLAVSLRSL